MTVDEAIEVFDRAVEGGLVEALRLPGQGFDHEEVRRRFDDLLGRNVRRSLVDALLYNRFLIRPRSRQGWDDVNAVDYARRNADQRAVLARAVEADAFLPEVRAWWLARKVSPSAALDAVFDFLASVDAFLGERALFEALDFAGEVRPGGSLRAVFHAARDLRREGAA